MSLKNQNLEDVFEAHAGYESHPDKQDALWADLVATFRHGGVPFDEQWGLYQRVFATRSPEHGPPFVWHPDDRLRKESNLAALMKKVGLKEYRELHVYSARERERFWEHAVKTVGIRWDREPERILDLDEGATRAKWFPGGLLNATDACFRAEGDSPAILYRKEGEEEIERVNLGVLEGLVARVQAGLQANGFRQGDRVALYMPMTPECVAAYLGIVRAGCAVVSIADSFAAPELATRLRIAEAKGIVTVDGFLRGGKKVDLYSKVREADAPRAVVIPHGGGDAELRDGDLWWDDFLGAPEEAVRASCEPGDVSNVLFSSGTTGDPKAIPWTHLTPFKAAVDGHYHQDIRPGDVVAWPTNIGWMMGPWLIYAALMNKATIALHEGLPTSEDFCRFVDEAGVTMLGVVPALVRAWRKSEATKDCSWERVRVFSSTGEASNARDYLWLMAQTGYRAPVIEYCGGTEIGGGHITGSVLLPASPATFSTPALGLDFVVLDESGQRVPVGGMGELFVVPPSVGLSDRLLNRDHDEVYHEGTPEGPDGQPLRRHGDEIERLGKEYWRAQGRADDTMNLGGIKVASIELERVMDLYPAVKETAAIGVAPPGGGSERLVVFAVPEEGTSDKQEVKRALQERIKSRLNPLFRIHDVVFVESLPRTASNKVMRRELRADYNERRT